MMRRTLVKLMTIVSRFDLPDRAVRRLSQMYLDASRGRWVQIADERTDGLRSDEREEMRRLRQENLRLREERDILARAAAWFARETSLPSKID